MKMTGVATLFFSMRIFFFPFFLRKESPNLVLGSPTAKERQTLDGVRSGNKIREYERKSGKHR